MTSPPLHSNITPPHNLLRPIIHPHLHFPLQHDPIVQRLRPMHQWFRTRSEIDNARDSAIGVDETKFAGFEELVVGVEVGVGVEGDGELGGGVDDVDGHGVVEEGSPGCGAGRCDFCGAVGVVAGYVVSKAREVGGELGGVWGSWVRHGCGWEVRSCWMMRSRMLEREPWRRVVKLIS